MDRHRPTRRPLLAVLLGAALALAAAGCGSSGSSVRSDASAPSTTAGAGPSTTAASGGGVLAGLPPDRVVWRDASGGGFVSVQAHVGEIADVTIQADGTIYVTDPAHRSGYDTPMPVRVGHVERAALEAFLAKAQASGLFASGVDLGRPGMSDLPTTTVALHLTGPQRSVQAYALDADVTAGVGQPYGITQDQADRRDALNGLRREARALARQTAPWAPDRVRAVAVGTPADPSTARPWPGPAFTSFPAPDAGGQSCLVIDGPAAARLATAAADNAGAAWTSGTETRQIVVVPILPGDQDCPSA